MADDTEKSPPIDWEKLTRPLDPEDIEWLQKGKPVMGNVQMVPYIRMQALRRRLDEVMPGRWSYTAQHIPFTSAVQATQQEPFAVEGSIYIDTGEKYQEVRRSSIGIGASWKEAETDAFKRVGQRLGIGNELYGEIGNQIVPVDKDNKPIDPKGKYIKAVNTAHANFDTDTAPALKVSGPNRDQIPQVEAKPGREAEPAKVYPPLDPPCPTCDGPMNDNRATKTKPTQPDFKCKKPRGECDGLWWKAKDYYASIGADENGIVAEPVSVKQMLERDGDDLPF